MIPCIFFRAGIKAEDRAETPGPGKPPRPQAAERAGEPGGEIPPGLLFSGLGVLCFVRAGKSGLPGGTISQLGGGFLFFRQSVSLFPPDPAGSGKSGEQRR